MKYLRNELPIKILKKSVAYSSQGSQTCQLDFCNWLMHKGIKNIINNKNFNIVIFYNSQIVVQRDNVISIMLRQVY